MTFISLSQGNGPEQSKLEQPSAVSGVSDSIIIFALPSPTRGFHWFGMSASSLIIVSTCHKREGDGITPPYKDPSPGLVHTLLFISHRSELSHMTQPQGKLGNTVFILGDRVPSWTLKGAVAMEEREKRHWGTARSLCNILQGIGDLRVCLQATPLPSIHRSWST